MTKLEKWQKVRATTLKLLAVCTILSAGFSYYQWGPVATAHTVITVLCLALGLWVSELLIAVFTGVRKANATAILMLFAGKILWWGALIAFARYLPPGNEKPIALGIVTFLISIMVSGMAHYGMPKISEIQE